MEFHSAAFWTFSWVTPLPSCFAGAEFQAE